MDEISEIDIGIWHILSSLWFLFTKRGTKTLGILSSQDGNAEVDIKRKKKCKILSQNFANGCTCLPSLTALHL